MLNSKWKSELAICLLVFSMYVNNGPEAKCFLSYFKNIYRGRKSKVLSVKTQSSF